MKRIDNLKELNVCLDNKQNDFIVILGGLLKSSKHITYSDTEELGYEILNLVDGSTTIVKASEIYDSKKTIIGEAMERYCFYVED